MPLELKKKKWNLESQYRRHFSQGKNTFSVLLNQRMVHCKQWHALAAGVNIDWRTSSITLNLTVGFLKFIMQNGNVLCVVTSHPF